MSNNSHWYVISGALVGVVAAVGAFLIEHIRQERRRQLLLQDMVRIDKQLTLTRQELQKLKLQSTYSKKAASRTKRNISTLSSSSTAEGYETAIDSESSGNEYFDISDDEDNYAYPKSLYLILDEIDSNMEIADMELLKEIITTLENLFKENSDHPEILYRIGKCYYEIAMRSATPLIKKQNVMRGVEACERALEIREDDADIHKWYAILVGLRSEFQPTKQRILDGYLFKDHIERALELSPTDPVLHHMLGRFKYEVAGLKWFERKVAKALFGEPPHATYVEALQCFTAAEKLTISEWKENKMFVGKCYAAMGDYEKAVEWLARANEVSDPKVVESVLNNEIEALLMKCENYR